MDKKQIETQIEGASFLSDVERKLLIDVLPSWPENSLDVLMKVLSDRAISSPKVSLKQTIAPAKITNPAQDTGSGASIEELKKRLTGSTVGFAKQKPRVQMQKPKLSTPQTINLKQKPSIAPKTPVPMPPPPHRVEGPSIDIESIKSSDQIEKVKISDLRNGDFRQNLDSILSKVMEISKQEDLIPYSVRLSFEKSPANQLFIKTGLALMDDITEDRKSAFVRVQSLMNSKYGESLTHEEFRIFGDFKEKLQQLV